MTAGTMAAWDDVSSMYAISEQAATPWARDRGLPAHELDDLIQEGVLWLLERPNTTWVREWTGVPLTPLQETIKDIQEHFDRQFRP